MSQPLLTLFMSSQQSTTINSRPDDLAELVFVALGSNLASKQYSCEQLLEQAFMALQDLSDRPIQRSSMWRSEPVDCPPDSPVFLNAVAALAPDPCQTPLWLLGKLQQIESDLGRIRSEVRNAPRTMDLDIICYQGMVSTDASLTLPHPAALKRLFVLAPLSEIAPGLILAGQQKTVRELMAACIDDGQSILKLSI